MNTPKPCDTCKSCKWNPMTEEDPNSKAECEYGLKMGDKSCSQYTYACYTEIDR